jgi:hypothetical protein
VKAILENTGAVELEWLGKFFVRLSDEPELMQRFLDELEEYGY